ncbi:MAG: hypothetical protein ACRDBG_21740 [Waterburya sp.]
MNKDPDSATNIIGMLAPISVITSWVLKSNGVDIPDEVQAAGASLLFLGACLFIGKPSYLSRKNRQVLKEYLPEAPLNPKEEQQFKQEISEDKVE